MKPSFLRRALLATTTLLALAVSGCSTGSTTSSGGPAADADPTAYPVTLTHHYGTTTITKPPTRVATLGWSDQDVALALGVAPVGAVKITWGGNAHGSTPWFDAKLAELGATAPTRYDDADGAPVEQIAALAPDLILATSSGITRAEYDKLSKIAPVVAYPGQAWGTSWQDSLALVGKALGREREAAALRRQTLDTIAATAAKFPQTRGRTFVFGALSATDTSKIDYYTPLDNRPRLLVDLGMRNAPFVEDAADGKAFFQTVSAERAGSLAADVFITYTTTPGEMDTLLADPLLRQIPAFRTGGYVDADNQTDALGMSAPSPLSIPYAMEKFVPLVAAAVDRAGAGS